MASTIGTAYVQIEPSTQGLSGKLSSALDSEATQAGASAGGKLSSALSGALGVGVTAVAGLTTAVAGAGAALTNAASGVAQYGDGIDKMSQKLGVSSSFYQEWDAVLQHSGTSMDSMSATFKKLATASQDASKDQVAAFEQLGLSMEDVANMSTEDLFTSVITGLQGMEEGTERTALATELLGKGAMEMGALLNTSSEDTQAMITTVNELGGVMSEDAVKASAGFQDSLQDMQTAFTGVKNQALSELLPSFTSIMDGFTGLITGSDDAKDKMKEGMESLTQSITSNLPQITETLVTLMDSFMEVAPELLGALAKGIIEAIPDLIPTFVQLVEEISKMIIENLPALIEAATEIILQLALGIADALPELIPTIVDTILYITEMLIDNIDLLVDAAIAIIVGLAEGLINALPRLIEKAPEIILKLADAIIKNVPKLLKSAAEIIGSLVKGLIDNLPRLLETGADLITKLLEKFKEFKEKIKEVGSDIIEGIKNGISDAWEGLKSWVTDKFESLVDGVCSVLKIGSPSKVFRDEVGRWIPEGVAVGIEANADSVTNALDDMSSNALVAAGKFANDMTISTDYSRASTSDSTMDNILMMLEKYMPYYATNDRLNNLNFNVNNREFARLVNGVS